jgi:hypothetical protein
MAKPPVSYGNALKLTPLPADPVTEAPERPVQKIEPSSLPSQPEASKIALAGRRRPMESRSDPTVLYLHPDGKYELKRYALARGPKVKVHDLIMEAVEEWAQRHGIAAPFRVPSERPRRSS